MAKMKLNKIETLRRFFSKSDTTADLKNLFLWFNSEKGHSEINHDLDHLWQSIEIDESIPVNSQKMMANIRKGIQPKKGRSLKTNFLRFVPYAAMLVITIGFSVLFYYTRISLQPNNSEIVSYTSVIAENGQKSKIILPDSSIVWLNSGTTLSYNTNFAENSRNINLKGQAFFQVTKNKKMPLIVHCNDLSVKVLGTKFDVNAYPETGKVSVVLESGSVQLLHNHIKSFNYTLKPSELADFDIAAKKVAIKNTDIQKFTSWKDGILIFKDDPMKQVIEKLERWYNIKIDVSDPEVYNSIFTGTISNESYEQIFKLIEYSCPVSCEIINRPESTLGPKIILTKN